MSKKVFERKIYQEMLNWKNESNGKTALLIKGQDVLENLRLLKNLHKTSILVIY